MAQPLPNESCSEHILGIALTRDDLEYAIDCLRAKGYAITIRDELYSYDSLDEVIAKRGLSPSQLQIDGKLTEPRYAAVSIEYSNGRGSMLGPHVYVSCHGSDQERALWHDLRSSLRRRQNWLRRFTDSVAFFLLPFCGFALDLFPLLTPSIAQPATAWLRAASALLMVVWLAGWALRLCVPAIRLSPRHQGGWARRHRSELVLVVVSGVFGAVMNELAHRIGSLLSPHR